MTYFVIVGIPHCPLFNHAKYVAQILSDYLPDFKIRIEEKSAHEYHVWLKELNLKHNWYHDKSPIVWKELTMRGGKPYLIGALGEFWEYCYDYYSLESIMPKKALQKLVNDSVQYFKSKKEMDKLAAMTKNIIICITGNKFDMIAILIAEILQLDEAFQDIILHFKVVTSDTDLANIAEDFEALPVKVKFIVETVEDMQEGLKNCDLLILTGHYTKYKEVDFNKWLKRNYEVTLNLADDLNLYGKRNLRVIIATNGPICFNATVLKETIISLHLHNIVVVTADLGLEILGVVSKLTNSPLKNLGGPPVWGFIGVNQLVDIDHIIQKFDVYRPNVRALKNKVGTTLGLGKNFTELRYMSYLTKDLKNIWKSLEGKKKSRYLPKIKSIVDLIENWYSPSAKGNIISLGIISDGSFGIPNGVFFSQPAILKEVWVPMSTFPIPDRDPCSIEDLIPFTNEILKQFQIIEE